MNSSELRPGQIMQLCPEKTRNPAFAGQLLVVEEPKVFGAVGYIMCDGLLSGVIRVEDTGRAYYRATFEEMEPTGGFVLWEKDNE